MAYFVCSVDDDDMYINMLIFTLTNRVFGLRLLPFRTNFDENLNRKLIKRNTTSLITGT